MKRSTSTDTKSKGALKSVGGATGLGSPSRGSAAGLSLSPARIPEVDPIDAAAHLQLLGESLSLIGHRLQETEVGTQTDRQTQRHTYTHTHTHTFVVLPLTGLLCIN